MTWLKDRLEKLRREFRVGAVHFLGEQDGPPERDLKERLATFFRTEREIGAAYLARVTYNDDSLNVACCIRMHVASEEDVVRRVSAIFSELFGSHAHLDILFLSQEQEAELSTVCNPFYQRTL